MTVRELKKMLEAAKETDHVYLDGEPIMGIDCKVGSVILSRHIYALQRMGSVTLRGQEYEFDYALAKRTK